MPEGKYTKYVNKLATYPGMNRNVGAQREALFFDTTVCKDAPIEAQFPLIYKAGSCYGIGRSPEWDMPHSHKAEEVFFFIGTNPEDHLDLGGEVEFWMGEGDEAEKFIITEPSAILVPSGVVHCPIYFRKVRYPILMVPIINASLPHWEATKVSEVLPPGFKK